ncbi:[Fe-Fe] hydrogenase large subunit C-terminal domain-containing protein [Lachnospiraceae bacterium LCP25S3_G4]
MNKFIRSVRLDKELCKGCINCIKHCPTQAIRVLNGKAVITDKFCIDCGKCIRYCPHHAKIPVYDTLDVLKDYKYTVALPAPSLYAQFNNLTNVDIVLNALLKIGFDDVYEVSSAAELVSEISRAYIAEHRDETPFISTACPTIVRLIRVKFPTLIPRLLPIKPPVEVAAEIALQKAMEKTGFKKEDIGIIFISPCPSKVTYAKMPLGIEKSAISQVVAIKDVYPKLLPHMSRDESQLLPLSHSGRIGIGWGSSGGEVAGLITDNYLAADGINSVLKVLEDLEDEKFHGLSFIELNSCSGGCVGGVLTVENPYVAKSKLKILNRYLPVARNHLNMNSELDIMWDNTIEYEPVFRLGSTFSESLDMMGTVEDLTNRFPGLDCGSCGAPTCKALAEDIVRGNATSNNCIYVFREYLSSLSTEIKFLARAINLSCNQNGDSINILKEYIEKLTCELDNLDDSKHIMQNQKERMKNNDSSDTRG